MSEVQGHDCVVCPYHGWAFDKEGVLRDVPAADKAEAWPRKQLVDSYAVQEKVRIVLGPCYLAVLCFSAATLFAVLTYHGCGFICSQFHFKVAIQQTAYAITNTKLADRAGLQLLMTVVSL